MEEMALLQGTTGKIKKKSWTRTQITNLGRGIVTHSFLVMPYCPYPLMGRDLLRNLQATISFHEDSADLSFNSSPSSILLMCPLYEKYLLMNGTESISLDTDYLQRLKKTKSLRFGQRTIPLGLPPTSPHCSTNQLC